MERLYGSVKMFTAIAVSTFFVSSFAYNFCYFYVLGIDLGRVPFTWTDYLTSINIIYWHLCIFTVSYTSWAIFGHLTSNEDTYSLLSSKKSKTKTITIFACILSALFTAVKNMLEFGIYAIPISYTFIPIIIAIAILVNKNIINKYYILYALFSIIVFFTSKAQLDAIQTYCNSEEVIYINGKSSYYLIRPIEKGYIVKIISDNTLLFINESGSNNIFIQNKNRSNICKTPLNNTK